LLRIKSKKRDFLFIILGHRFLGKLIIFFKLKDIRLYFERHGRNKRIMKRTIIFYFLVIFSLFTMMNGKPKKPNILILYADDLGYGDLKILNSKSKIPTPNLEKLAKEGMIFTDGHSSSGICKPSLLSICCETFHPFIDFLA
jgi:hypothetical protein